MNRSVFCTVLLVGTILGLPSALSEDKIDCGYALTKSERAYCAGQALNKAETEMKAAFEETMVKMAALDDSLPTGQKGGQESLRQAQAAWLAFRDQDCHAYSFAFRLQNRSEEVYQGCTIVMTMQRTEELKAIFEDQGD